MTKARQTFMLSNGKVLKASPPVQKEDGILHVVELDLPNNKLGVLQRWRGMIRFHLREWDLDSAGKFMRATKRGIAMTMQQTRDASELMEFIHDFMTEVS